MQRHIIAWASTALVFVALDAFWLSTMQGFYRRALGELMLEQGFRPAPAIIFYLIFISGIVVFAVAPALAGGRALPALVYGAFFGFCSYATYDLTNQATLARWPASLTLVDLAWGTVLSGASGFFGAVVAGLILSWISAP